MLRVTLTLCILLLIATLSMSKKKVLALNLRSLGQSDAQSATPEGKSLLTIIRDESLRQNEPDRVVQAIKRLGELKSTEAIAPLVQLLTFSRTYPWEDKKVDVDIVDVEHLVGISGRYPAVGALFMIGKPSLPALVEVIEEEESLSVASVNALYAVRQIFRDSPLEAVEFLRSAAAKASSVTKFERLIQAAESAEKDTPGSNRPRR